jgi:hypothetical protein
MMSQVVSLKDFYKPHKGQLRVHLSPARWKILSCGARWGKDRASIMEMIWTVLWLGSQPRPASLVPKVLAWYVAPTYQMARQGWRELLTITARLGIQKGVQRKDYIIYLPNDIVIEVKSADRPETLKAVGLDVLVMTESALVPEEAWYESLQPRLISPHRLGKAILNSTPRGKNWFYEIFQAGLQDGKFIASFHAPTWENPYIPKEEIEHLRQTMPPHKFAQEIEAKFVTNEQYIFLDYLYSNFILPREEEPKPTAKYIAGVDFGRVDDFTAVAIFEVQGSVYYMRDYLLIRHESYGEIMNRVVALLKKWNVSYVAVESVAFQEVLIDELASKVKTHVAKITTTATNRNDMIDKVVLKMSSKELFMIDSDELREHFKYVSWDGNKYKHDKGKHDDMMMATALAL